MSSSEWTAIAALAAAVLAIAITYLQFNATVRLRKLSSEQFEVVVKGLVESQIKQNFSGNEVLAQVAEELSRSAYRLTESIGEFPYRLAPILEDFQSSTRVAIHQTYASPGAQTTVPGPDSAQIIRELAHSLGTPLAQIKAQALRLAAANEGERVDLEKIIAAVDLSNSFIGAFREIARISGPSSKLPLASLSKALRTAADVYLSKVNKLVKLSISVPEQTEEYTNAYLLSILAPLIENAIEASPEGEDVSIAFVPDESKIVFNVKNKFLGDPPGAQSFAPGASTKDGHEGMGLSTVRRLVEARREGIVSCAVDGQTVSFSIEIPRSVHSGMARSPRPRARR